MKRTSVVGRLMASAFAISIMGAVPAQATVGGVAQLGKACTATPTAKFAPALDGMVRGFLETGCHGSSIDYLSWEPQHHSKGTVELSTPYRGVVLATAQDPTFSYLLYRASDGVRLGKVGRAGVASPSLLLSKANGGGLDGSVAAAGGGWYAIWTEPKAVGGFALHSAASPQYELAANSAVLSGAGFTDSAPDIARIGATKHNFLLTFARHTASGYHLMVAHRGTPWAAPKEIDASSENPQPAVTRAGVYTDIAWLHGTTVRLATTQGGLPYYSQTALHELAIPQPVGGGTVGAPQVAYDCGKLYVAFTSGGENSGKVWVDVLSDHQWSRHVVRVAKTAAPVLAGLAPRCASTEVLWTEAGRLLIVKV